MEVELRRIADAGTYLQQSLVVGRPHLEDKQLRRTVGRRQRYSAAHSRKSCRNLLAHPLALVQIPPWSRQ